MKKLLLLLALSVGLRADIVGPTVMQQLDGPTSAPISGSLTYALNQSLTGVASSAIDLDGAIGIYLTLTSTGSALIDLRFSNASLTYAAKTYTLQSGFSYWVPMRGRYLTLYNSGTNQPTARTSAYYYKAVPVGGGSGGGAVATSTSITTALSSVAMPTYAVLSQTATVINVTTLAGVSTPCVVCLSSNGGPAAGFKVQFPENATPRGVTASVGHYVAASTTAQCWGPFQPGTHVELGGVAAVSSVSVDVQKMVRVAVP